MNGIKSRINTHDEVHESYCPTYLEDFDEDVLLRNSPLDEYLRQVTQHSFDHYEPNVGMNTEPKATFTENESYENLTTKVHNCILKKQLHTQEVLKSCILFSQITALSEQDEILLHDLLTVIKRKFREHSSKKVSIMKYQPVFLNSYYMKIACFVVIASVAVGIFITAPLHYSVIFCFFLAMILLASWNFVKGTFTLHQDILSSTESFCTLVDKCDKLLDKSVVYLKELEVIYHGKIPIHLETEHAWASSGQGQKGVKLRNFIVDNVSKIFLKLRINQKVLLQNNVEDCIHDYKEEYIAQLPMDSFTPLLSSTSPLTSTQEVSLDKVKAIIFCYRFLLSEFAYRIIVSLFVAYNTPTQANHSIVTDIMFSISDVLQLLASFCNKLENLLTVHTKQHCATENLKKPNKAQAVKTVEDFLHSAQINLQSALARIDNIRDLYTNQQKEISEEKTKDSLQCLCVSFNLAVENSRCCIEDVFDALFPRNSSKDAGAGENVQLQCDNVENVKMFQPSETEGDILLEGESESLCKNYEKQNPDKNKESLKANKQSRKLMRELKTILSVKDTPIGLLTFPLKKPEVAQIDSEEEEFMCTKRSDEFETFKSVPKLEDKKKAYIYDPEEHGGDFISSQQHIKENEEFVRFTLPKDFLTMLPKTAVEDTFGSSGDEEDASVTEKH